MPRGPVVVGSPDILMSVGGGTALLTRSLDFVCYLYFTAAAFSVDVSV